MSSVNSIKICDYAPKTNPTQVCGMEIQWNDNLKGFESVKFPGFKHGHRLVCRTEGCGGDIFFNDYAPKGERTGRPQPLEVPIPINKQWVLHAHKKVISTEVAQRDPLEPVPSTTGITDPATVTVAQAQAAVERPNIVSGNTVGQIPDPVPSTAGASKEQLANELVNQIEVQLRWQHDVLKPSFEDMKSRFERLIGPIEAWVSIMARAGFKSAADIQRLGEDMIRKAEIADTLAERESNLQKNSS